ncbi:glutaredoxin 3 [Moraxella cuniculi DSM 21768]|uniref:Glutaredoxin n=2 Tax=Moraxella cuniculi TaxID=34061 RepID=A0A1N7F3Z2_9GAMM|nr:glutaredoxin 3 [Moraxella cuniculi]OOS05003.1 glutaredoxin 3 [Moraxella cuniculi]SIR95031.1 glutaredoxin 3 [Moraxella cuniculi DSM 21768]VEG13847.1 Glutaredoxin-3 [Moraxella cuniculi]
MKTVTIYTTATCPYCIAAKQLLNSKSVAFDEIDFRGLTDDERQQLSDKTKGYRTVPQIFIGDEFVGGFDQLNALNNAGKLDQLLA